MSRRLQIETSPKALSVSVLVVCNDDGNKSTTRTKRIRPKRTHVRAFTLVEMTIVVFILGIIASTLISRLMVQQEGNKMRNSIQKIESAAYKAEQLAVTSGQVRTLGYDESTQSLTISQAADSSDLVSNQPNNTLRQSSSNSSGQDSDISESLGAGWTVNEVRNSSSETESTLSIKFYPDGTAEPKSVQFQLGDLTVVLKVTADGRISVTRGAIEDDNQQEWEAGQLEQRSAG
ncbi:MAG: pilus assembly FimT family protein [Fimbriimonas sp.]|jgi:prepilin-type N-terminal cleavage/methylation domain-containing protein